MFASWLIVIGSWPSIVLDSFGKFAKNAPTYSFNARHSFMTSMQAEIYDLERLRHMRKITCSLNSAIALVFDLVGRVTHPER